MEDYSFLSLGDVPFMLHRCSLRLWEGMLFAYLSRAHSHKQQDSDYFLICSSHWSEQKYIRRGWTILYEDPWISTKDSNAYLMLFCWLWQPSLRLSEKIQKHNVWPWSSMGQDACARNMRMWFYGTYGNFLSLIVYFCNLIEQMHNWAVTIGGISQSEFNIYANVIHQSLPLNRIFIYSIQIIENNWPFKLPRTFHTTMIFWQMIHESTDSVSL